MLKERFGDPQQIISSHMEGLLKIPSCSSDRSCSLRSVYDKIMVNIRGLEALGVTSEQYGSLLIPVIMTKFPSEIRLRIAREIGKNVWKITPVLNILKAEVEAREVSEGSTIIVRWLNKFFVTKRIKAPFLVHKFIMMHLLILEGVPSKTTYVPMEKQNGRHCI